MVKRKITKKKNKIRKERIENEKEKGGRKKNV